MSRRRGPWPALLLAVGGCIASNVVAPEQRLVVDDPAQLEFAPADGQPLDGLYASIDLRGAAAAALRKIYYRFAADGTYTAAALSEVDGRYAFETLSGIWALAGDQLVLDDGDAVRLERAPQHLRITAPNGVLVLRREDSL